MLRKNNPLSVFAMWVVLVSLATLLIGAYFEHHSLLRTVAPLLVGVCSLTLVLWTLFEFRRGQISMVLQNGQFTEYSRKKEPVRFYFLLIVYLGTGLFLFWAVCLDGVPR